LVNRRRRGSGGVRLLHKAAVRAMFARRVAGSTGRRQAGANESRPRAGEAEINHLRRSAAVAHEQQRAAPVVGHAAQQRLQANPQV